MFEKKYKNAMDSIKPSQDAIEKTRLAMNAEKSKGHSAKNMLRMASIACLCVALIATTVFAAFKINDAFNINGFVSDSKSPDLEQTDDYEGLKPAGSYEHIYKLLDNIKRDELSDYEFTVDIGINDAVLEEAPEEETDGISGTGDTHEYSDTNNQVQGVQEADIVKTDGKYIYYCDVEKMVIRIVKAENGITEHVSDIFVANDFNYVKEMLLIGDRLVVIGFEYGSSYYGSNSGNVDRTVCLYYDISDRSEPTLVNTLTQDGNYESSRAIDGNVYIISTKSIYSYYEDTSDFEPIPEVSGELIAAEDILIPDEVTSACFTVITAYDALGDSAKHKSSIAILGNVNSIYSAKENIYITRRIYNNETGEKLTRYNTCIYRIAMNDGELRENGCGYVPGLVENQFWMDENDGKLRVATHITYYTTREFENYVNYTIDQELNRVYCLDDDMKVIGISEDLGVTEQIKSVRYIGDVAYVVTFRQTDPLYAIDLSDPTSPKTLSELKIDGFSSYMHPYGDGLLIGIGFDADPQTGIQTGIKLTMFDISDPTDISDISTSTYSWDQYGYTTSASTYNHKAVLIDAKKGIIAIPMSQECMFENEYGGYDWKFDNYFVFFEFDGKTLVEKGRVSTVDENSEYKYVDSRGLYIGDYGYIVSNDGVVSISLNKLEIISRTDF